MKPWRQSGWFSDRARELVYQAMSWPYFTALALTWLFFVKTDAIVRDAMLIAWTLAFGRRLGARWLDGKFSVGNDTPPAAPVGGS